MPHVTKENFNLVRKYFLEDKDVIIHLSSVKTFKVIKSCVYFYDANGLAEVVDFFSHDLAMKEFGNIMCDIYDFLHYKKKND